MLSEGKVLPLKESCERDFLSNACPTKVAHKSNFLWVTSN